MPTYALRGIPEGLIPRAKTRASEDGTTLDAVLIRYLETYADGVSAAAQLGLGPEGARPARRT